MARRLICGVIASTGATAYLTKPSNESFAAQTTMNLGIITKVLATEFINHYAKFDDYIFFRVVTFPTGDTEDDRGKAIGIFNGWYTKKERE